MDYLLFWRLTEPRPAVAIAPGSSIVSSGDGLVSPTTQVVVADTGHGFGYYFFWSAFWIVFVLGLVYCIAACCIVHGERKSR